MPNVRIIFSRNVTPRTHSKNLVLIANTETLMTGVLENQTILRATTWKSGASWRKGRRNKRTRREKNVIHRRVGIENADQLRNQTQPSLPTLLLLCHHRGGLLKFQSTPSATLQDPGPGKWSHDNAIISVVRALGR